MLKSDRDESDPQAVREKIAVDLALVLGLLTPAAVLCKPMKEQVYWPSVVTARDFQHVQSMDIWRSAVLAESEEEDDPTLYQTELQALTSSYDICFVAFDLWVGNSDRRTNLGNLLVVEEGTGTRIIPIDYGNCLGDRFGSWRFGRHQECQWDEEKGPVPVILDRSQLAGLDRNAIFDRIEAVDNEVIEFLVSRALDYFDSKVSSADADAFLNGLIYRRDKVREWTKERL